jgi:GAF domain
MDSPAQLEAPNSSVPNNALDGSAAFIETASIEFFSSLQLLAERARFLTGAFGIAIALKKGRNFVYCASVGNSHEPGRTADTQHVPVSTCITTAKPFVVSSSASGEPQAKAAIPIVRQQQVAGFIELYAKRPSLSPEDVTAATSLADLVTTALDHMEAVENANQRIMQVSPARLQGETPIQWHAGNVHESPAQTTVSPPATPAPLDIHTCQSCGFPVSDGRTLCVECEQKPDAPRIRQPQLLVTENDDSWISTHGYTIASLLVTALVAAIIYWLR